MELFDDKEKEELEGALEKCKFYISKGATINVIESSFDAINFSTHDITAVATLTAAMKKVLYYLPFIEHSDSSKEKSSMDYYNQMRYWEDKAIYYRDMLGESLKYVAEFKDCPLENEDVDLDCERRCATDFGTLISCWEQYFKKKVEEYDEKGKQN